MKRKTKIEINVNVNGEILSKKSIKNILDEIEKKTKKFPHAKIKLHIT